MAVYYIDERNGCDAADGRSPESAKRDYTKIKPMPGDSILFRRGSFYRSSLRTVGGADGKPITYGAWGEGDKPVFSGSVDVSRPEDWEEIRPDVWRCIGNIPKEACNFSFDGGESFGTLRWEAEALSAQGDFWDSRFGTGERGGLEGEPETLLFSHGNPGTVYRSIECAHYGERSMARIHSNMILENLAFQNSGVHGCAGAGRNVIIRGCDFHAIGGCVWNKELKIRFGNAVEFWIDAVDVLVERNAFRDVYDSCVTHQGPGNKTVPAERFVCRDNRFDTYGMAAFEYRDKLPVDSCFEHNICTNAGCGFAMQGETLPRRSEIWPQPMGHHIFLWRIPTPSEGGSLRIVNNEFGPAPVGAAIYSIISPEAEAQITLENNVYTEAGSALIWRFGGQDYADFDAYREAVGRDRNSVIRR